MNKKTSPVMEFLTLLEDVRTLSHRVDHVSEKVTQNIARVESLIGQLNEISSLQTVYEEKNRKLARQMKKMNGKEAGEIIDQKNGSSGQAGG